MFSPPVGALLRQVPTLKTCHRLWEAFAVARRGLIPDPGSIYENPVSLPPSCFHANRSFCPDPSCPVGTQRGPSCVKRTQALHNVSLRSEERRVGKECRS